MGAREVVGGDRGRAGGIELPRRSARHHPAVDDSDAADLLVALAVAEVGAAGAAVVAASPTPAAALDATVAVDVVARERAVGAAEGGAVGLPPPRGEASRWAAVVSVDDAAELGVTVAAARTAVAGGPRARADRGVCAPGAQQVAPGGHGERGGRHRALDEEAPPAGATLEEGAGLVDQPSAHRCDSNEHDLSALAPAGGAGGRDEGRRAPPGTATTGLGPRRLSACAPETGWIAAGGHRMGRSRARRPRPDRVRLPRLVGSSGRPEPVRVVVGPVGRDLSRGPRVLPAVGAGGGARGRRPPGPRSGRGARHQTRGPGGRRSGVGVDRRGAGRLGPAAGRALRRRRPARRRPRLWARRLLPPVLGSGSTVRRRAVQAVRSGAGDRRIIASGRMRGARRSRRARGRALRAGGRPRPPRGRGRGVARPAWAGGRGSGGSLG